MNRLCESVENGPLDVYIISNYAFKCFTHFNVYMAQ